jgi:hypothetical protein
MSAAGLRLLATVGALLSVAAAPAPTVDEIVARHLAARGGARALAAVRTVRMVGLANAGPGKVAIVRREIARPGRIRTEFVFQGTTGVYVWDGTSGWRVSPLDGKLEAEPLAPDAAAISAEQADIEGPLVDWKAKGHQVELVGTEALPGGPAHDLKVTLKSGAVRHVFVDAATGQIVRSTSTRKVRGHETEFDVVFSDFRETGGVTFARAIDIGARGRAKRLLITVDSVELNPKIDDARFAQPPR